jgi:LysR family glycine cleavage system transcriptional activator
VAYRLPPLSTFRTFEVAARHLSFRYAADELHVTPSAVSQQIKTLESYLGLALFQRLPNGLQLTDDGAAMIPKVREGLDCFVAGVASTRQGRQTLLTVSSPHSFATRWLVPHLPHFSAAHPGVTIRISSNPDAIDGAQVSPARAKEAIDPRQQAGEVAIRFGNGVYPGYRVERLLVPEYVLVCSPLLCDAGATPLRTPEDLRQQVLIHDETIPVVDRRPSWSEWCRIAGIAGVDTKRGPRFSNSVLVHEAALEGQGVALVIRQHVEADVAAGRLVIPFTITLPAEYAYFLVIPERDAGKAVVLAFAQWIRAEIGGAAANAGA